MNNRTLKSSLVIFALVCGLALQPLVAFARAGRTGQEQSGAVSINNTQGRVSVKLDRGSRVAISNRYGRITITGWERDTVEAVATSDKGPEAIKVDLTADPQSRSVLTLSVPGRQGERRTLFTPGMDFDFDFNPSVAVGVGSGSGMGIGVGRASSGGSQTAKDKADKDKEKDKEKTPGADSNVVIVPMPDVVVRPGVVVTPRPGSAPRAQAPQPAQPRGQAPPPARAAESSGINLDVKIPRYAELSTIEVRSGDLTVSNVDCPVNIVSGSSDVKVSRVGAVEVRARGGSVTVEDVQGLAFVSASSGDIIVRRAQGDVRAVSLNGDIDIQCVRGRVDVSNARGAIRLAAISGDVDATTTSSDIVYSGPIQDNGRYRLKAIEGAVRMAIPDNSPGFTALISSYSGAVATDFAIRNQNATPEQRVNHRMEARQGNGQAQITLDSFSKDVRLIKLTTPTVSCQ